MISLAVPHTSPKFEGQAFQQVATKLRAAILTRRLEPGDKLPPQPDLASRFGVARETVKRALEMLRTNA